MTGVEHCFGWITDLVGVRSLIFYTKFVSLLTKIMVLSTARFTYNLYGPLSSEKISKISSLFLVRCTSKIICMIKMVTTLC